MKNVTVTRSNNPSTPEGPAPAFIRDLVLEQPVFFNDTSSRHWFFDFKVQDIWISAVNINNELTEFTVEVFNVGLFSKNTAGRG